MHDNSFFDSINNIDSQSDASPSNSNALSSAREEKELFDIRNDAKINKHKNIVLIISIYLMFLIATIAIIIRAFHLFAPSTWTWLNENELNTFDKLIFSGVIGGVLTKYSSKVIK